jgi:hypothetical protein
MSIGKAPVPTKLNYIDLIIYNSALLRFHFPTTFLPANDLDDDERCL